MKSEHFFIMSKFIPSLFMLKSSIHGGFRVFLKVEKQENRDLRPDSPGTGLCRHSPNYEEVYDLLKDRMIAPGVIISPKAKPARDAGPPTYRRLEAEGQRLLELIAVSRGRTNKDLAKLADQLKAIMDKWE